MSTLASNVSRSGVMTSMQPMASLSCFQIKINRMNVDEAVNVLSRHNYEILAIYIVSRPTDRYKAMNFLHWAVKMVAPPLLITMDFTVSSGGAGFTVETVMASQCEYEDFFHYYKLIKNKNYDPNRSSKYNKYIYEKNKWDLLSYVEPIYNEEDGSLTPIACDMVVSKLADFVCNYAAKTKDYNAVRNNCQYFAYKLYKFVVGAKYPDKINQVKKLLQSPYDQTRVKRGTSTGISAKRMNVSDASNNESKEEIVDNIGNIDNIVAHNGVDTSLSSVDDINNGPDGNVNAVGVNGVNDLNTSQSKQTAAAASSSSSASCKNRKSSGKQPLLDAEDQTQETKQSQESQERKERE